MNGNPWMTGFLSSLKPEIKEGHFKYFFEDSTLKSECEYRNDKKEGESKTYYENGNLRLIENYKEDKLDGKRIGYYDNKKVKRIEEYKNGEMIQGKCFTMSGEDTTYYPYMKMPTFATGTLENYISENLKYPMNAADNHIEGTVFLAFTVNKEGYVENLRILRSINHDLDKAALEVIKYCPRWNPGMEDGKPVHFDYNIPIRLGV
jgi:TonB family protein